MYRHPPITTGILVSVVILALFGLLSLTGPARADGWYTQTAPTTVNLTGVSFVSADEGWICGGAGVILHTTDGGAHWVTQFSGTTLNLVDVSFANAQVGYVIGDSKIMLRTSNGGATWQMIDQPQQDYPWAQIQALDSQRVWRGGTVIEEPFTSGVIEWSGNGGASWSGYSMPCVPYPPHNVCNAGVTSIYVVNSQVAYFSAYRRWYDGSQDNTMFRTSDGGTTWVELPPPQPGSPGMQFLNPTVGYATYGYVYKTTDAGNTWTMQPTSLMATQVSFVDVTHGWSVGPDGDIGATSDGGTTWVQQASGTTQTLNRVQFVDYSVGTAVGNQGTILHTISGGDPTGSVADPAHGSASRLLPPVPNPFSHQARIAYELSASAQVFLGVFDASGRLVRLLDEGSRAAGRHTISWNGKDASGIAVSRGVYFVRLNGAGVGGAQQVTIVR